MKYFCRILSILVILGLSIIPGVRAQSHDVKALLLEMKESFKEISDFKCVLEDYQSNGRKTT